ncbi:ABC transporter substrate-binding protein [Rhodococcus erythropolis]|uniref:ABC transporter substrate-binding protein n=1 Tax=Rhodococcus erythropolis TaxID=1833 RepID=UPI001BE56E0E|nr:ABC transporter substrate-binding protein [Rhodococcus erythropolis]MBT2268980.1 ABC transporter substrate-binding protein [Rhodococcus erythropolis]
MNTSVRPRCKRLLPVVVGLAMSLTLAGCGGSAAGGGEQGGAGTVNLGFINPMSGPYATLGVDQKNALDLYLKQHDNKLGGREVNLVAVDEGAGPTTGLPAARKLIQQERVDVATGVVSSATAAAVLPLFESAKTPIVFTQGYPYADPNPSPSPYSWTVGSTFPPYATTMAQHMSNVIDKSNSVYFLGADYNVGHELVDQTVKSFTEQGGEVAGTAFPPYGTTLDYQPYLAKVKESGASAVYAFFAGSDAVRFVQQYAEFGLQATTPLYSTTSLTAGSALDAQGKAAVGTVTAGFYDQALPGTANQEFIAAYTQAYGSAPDVFSVQQYDSMTVLDRALAKIDGTLSGDKITAALKTVGDLETPRGTWTLDPVLQSPIQKFHIFEVVAAGDGVKASQISSTGPLDPISGEPR